MANSLEKNENINESFQTAKQYAAVIGAMPIAFSTTIRALMVDFQSGASELSENSKYQVGRLVSAPTIHAALGYLALTTKPREVAEIDQADPLSLANLFDPVTLAAAISQIYLFKRAKRICSQEDWRFLAEPWQKNIEVAMLLGNRGTDVGFGVGLLGVGMLYTAYSAFLAFDKKGFAEYRRHLKRQKILTDLAYEMKQWGCSCFQVASHIMLSLSFGRPLVGAWCEGFGFIPGLGSFQTSGYTTRFRFVRNWIDTVVKHEDAISKANVGIEGLDTKTTETLIESVRSLLEQTSEYRWLEKEKADLAEFCKKFKKAAAVPSASVKYEDLPESIRGQLSVEEFKQLAHMSLAEILEVFKVG